MPPYLHFCAAVRVGSQAALEMGRTRGDHMVRKTTEKCLRISPYCSPCSADARLCLTVSVGAFHPRGFQVAIGPVRTATWRTAPSPAA